VREDVPKAREEQKREEQEALELRFRQLSLLQQQAEEDGRIARLILEREEAESALRRATAAAEADLDFDILDRQPFIEAKESEDAIAASRIESLLLVRGAAAAVCLSDEELEGAVGLSPRSTTSNKSGNAFFAAGDDFQDPRYVQEENDAAIARKLQEEMEQLERDKMLAIEAQDRELAKMIHEKERARLKRAKERAKLKAAAAATLNQNQESSNSHADSSPTNSTNPEKNHPLSILRTKSAPISEIPPKIPEKIRPSGMLDSDDPIGFRASPKPLPPQPSQSQANNHGRLSSSTSNTFPNSGSSSRRDGDLDPIPPYMPMQGFNRASYSSPRKNK
jgi:hypothetical protein